TTSRCAAGECVAKATPQLATRTSASTDTVTDSFFIRLSFGVRCFTMASIMAAARARVYWTLGLDPRYDDVSGRPPLRQTAQNPPVVDRMWTPSARGWPPGAFVISG